MRRSHKNINILLLIHPAFMAGLTTFLGLLSTLVSPKWYSNLLNEPNLMYGNLKLWIYTVLSSLLFCIYAWMFSRNNYIRISNKTELEKSANSFTGKLVLLISLVFNFSIFYLLQSTVGVNRLISGINGGGASELRLDIDDIISIAKLNWVAPFTVASILWGYWTLPIRKGRFNLIILIFTFAIFVLSSLITLTRGPIFELIASFGILVMLKRMRNRQMNLFWLLRLSLISITLLLTLFVGVDSLRRIGHSSGQQQSSQIIKTFVGYFPASYNRLAAVIDYKLRIPNSGAAYYTIQGLWDTPVISSFLYKFGRDVGLDLPSTTRENWRGQFSAVASAGLQRDYIWATNFGFAFADWGWFGLIWFAISGALTGYLYTLFKRSTVSGIVMYPFALVSILQWWSISTLIQRRFVIFLFFSLLIRIITFVYKRSRITMNPDNHIEMDPTKKTSNGRKDIYG